MSVISFLKKAAHTVGTVGKYAAPVLAMTGVGAPLAAGIEAASAGLSHVGQKGATLGSALKDAALSGAGTYALGSIRHSPGGIGGALHSAGNYLGDPKAGAGRIAALTGLAGAGLGAVGAGQAQAANNEQAGYERTRAAMYDPQRQALLDLFMRRLGGGTTPAPAPA